MHDTIEPLIVFDLGGVLIDWDPRYLYREFFSGNDAAMDHFLAEICSPAWNVLNFNRSTIKSMLSFPNILKMGTFFRIFPI